MPCAFHAERPTPFDKLDPGCQFKVQEDQLTEVDGETWCDYHLPSRKEDKYETQKAQWNNERIEQFNKAVIAWIAKAFDEMVVCGLTGTVFPGAIDFSKIQVFPPVSFSNTQFSGNAVFEQAQFSGDAGFENAQFSDYALFSRAQFSGPGSSASFVNAQFSGNTDFCGTQFSCWVALFNKAQFSVGHAWFMWAQFSGMAVFDEAQFHEGVSFIQAQFSNSINSASFAKAQFSGPAGFKEAQFSGEADFREAQFSGKYAWFNKAQFSGPARFENAQFSGNAGFEQAQFSRDASFENAQFSRDARFQSAGDTSTPEAIRANIFHVVTFENVVFNGSVSFLNRQFLDTTRFKGCVFIQAPTFHNCALHQSTNFDGAKFFDMSSEDAVQAYRTLKLAMENIRARQEEAMFYALEQQSLRARKDTPWLVRVASHLYHRTAHYGQSFGLPLGWLLGITIVCFFIYAAFGSISSGGQIVDFTIEQLVRPFNVWLPRSETSLHNLFGENLLIRLGIKVIATFQSIFSLSLLALFLLALRRRFKMG